MNEAVLSKAIKYRSGGYQGNIGIVNWNYSEDIEGDVLTGRRKE